MHSRTPTQTTNASIMHVRLISERLKPELLSYFWKKYSEADEGACIL